MKLVIVTGMSGAGKTIALKMLEAESVREVRVRKSWKLTDVLSKTGSHS